MSLPRFRAVVLAAGLGTRLRPLTASLPKPLLPVAGTPLLGRTLAALAEAGCEKAAINLFYQGDKIETHFGYSFAGMELVYSPEEEILGTLGALSQLSDFLADTELAVVLNGDSLCRWPITKMLRKHRRSTARVTLLASLRASLEVFGGGIGLDGDGGVVSFAPGRDLGEVEKRVVFAGMHVFAPDLVAGLEVRRADFVRDLYEPLLRAGERIEAVETSRPWFDLGTPARYLAGVCEWAQRRGPAKIAGRSWISPQAAVDRSASLRRSVIESGVTVGEGAQLENAVVLPDARIGSGCRLRESIVGSGVELPAETSVERRLITRIRADQPPGKGDSVVGGLVYSPLA